MSPRAELLAKWRDLKRPERQTFLLAFALLPILGLALRLFGLRRVKSVLDRIGSGHVPEASPANSSLKALKAAGSARLVAAAARHGLYRASCLPVSLALGWLLRRDGIRTDLRLGVRKTGARLEAHAWIEHRGVPLIETQAVHERFAAFDKAVGSRPSSSG